MAFNASRRPLLLAEMRRALPWAAGLVLAQLAALSLAFIDSDFKMLGRFALLYLVFAVLFPVIWAVGQVWGQGVSLPMYRNHWSGKQKLTIAAVMGAAGLILNFLLVLLIDVRVGASVKDMTEGIPPVALGVMAVWMIFNAPWFEELTLRHYLVARIAAGRPVTDARRALWTTGAVITAAAIFAVGHTGHMEPAWPKLVQTFTWGLMLGWARVQLGTWYAVALHLSWNVTAPLVAPLVGGDI